MAFVFSYPYIIIFTSSLCLITLLSYNRNIFKGMVISVCTVIITWADSICKNTDIPVHIYNSSRAIVSAVAYSRAVLTCGMGIVGSKSDVRLDNRSAVSLSGLTIRLSGISTHITLVLTENNKNCGYRGREVSALETGLRRAARYVRTSHLDQMSPVYVPSPFYVLADHNEIRSPALSSLCPGYTCLSVN